LRSPVAALITEYHMRPITNILLVLALICYVFLSFYDISLMGHITGLGYTAGTISQFQSIGQVALSMLPFIACFGAVALNCLKRRWWVLGSIACILLWLWFYHITSATFHDISLQHAPELMPENDLGEGFSITGMGIGYKLSSVLTLLSLLSAIVSMLPFKFNDTIEKAVDDTFEGGRRHVREEFNRLENNLHKPHKGKKNDTMIPADENQPTTPPVEEDKEDPSRFMPQ